MIEDKSENRNISFSSLFKLFKHRKDEKVSQFVLTSFSPTYFFFKSVLYESFLLFLNKNYEMALDMY
jgi:hypothetical protein